MSWKKDCPGAGAAPARVAEAEGLVDPSGEGRAAGHCSTCDHRYWMKEADTIPPHGVPESTRPKGTEIRELDD